MAEDIDKRFNKGDFLRKDNKKGSFMIYEGNNISSTSYKRMTLVCFYDPEAFTMGPIGYENKPKLELSTSSKPCETTIDTEEEDFWIKKCSPLEREEAERILAKYGLIWNEDSLELIDIASGEVVKKIIVPDDTYYGQIIRPITEKFKELLHKWVFKKMKAEYSYSSQYPYDYYDD